MPLLEVGALVACVAAKGAGFTGLAGGIPAGGGGAAPGICMTP
jgi:hypothetical protein